MCSWLDIAMCNFFRKVHRSEENGDQLEKFLLGSRYSGIIAWFGTHLEHLIPVCRREWREEDELWISRSPEAESIHHPDGGFFFFFFRSPFCNEGSFCFQDFYSPNDLMNSPIHSWSSPLINFSNLIATFSISRVIVLNAHPTILSLFKCQ